MLCKLLDAYCKIIKENLRNFKEKKEHIVMFYDIIVNGEELIIIFTCLRITCCTNYCYQFRCIHIFVYAYVTYGTNSSININLKKSFGKF